MTSMALSGYTVFQGQQRLVAGELLHVAQVVKETLGAEQGAEQKAGQETAPILVFDNNTGKTVDLDLRGSLQELAERYPVSEPTLTGGVKEDAGNVQENSEEGKNEETRRGRPRLGVVAREVTLLPRHWEWLASQPGGASVALRKLVEDARRANSESDRRRQVQERAYHFMSAIAGDLPYFEEASRALFANDREKFAACIAGWPRDVRDHAGALAFGE